MEGVEVVCVEIQENEDGEIVYVEKMENNNSESPEEYCVMECEIATSENLTKSSCEETSSPVEIIVFPNFSEKFPHCVTNEEELSMKKVVQVKDECDLNLKTTEQISCKDNVEFIDGNETDEDFDIVLKLEMSDSDTDSDEPVDHKFEEQKVKEEIPEVPEDSLVLQKSKLWTLLDKQDRCNTPSKGRVTTTSGSLDVRRTYSGILPKKSYRESDDGFSQLPFRCKVCDQSFRQDSSLKIHLKVHAGKYSDGCIIN